MELHNDYVPNYEPLLLLRNESYPTYQLYAIAGGKEVPAHTVLTICILETMKWLRQRFRAFDLPSELDMPDTSQYKNVQLTHFSSFYLNRGYKLEVIWLRDESIWTLQLTEPDIGTRPGEKDQARAPVPGRLIETNISYHIVSDGVKCGFQTIISEPEGSKQDCEVFRLAFIKNLARNKLVGLRQTFPMLDTPISLNDLSVIKKYKKWIVDSDRSLPVIVFSEFDPSTVISLPDPLALKEQFIASMGRGGACDIGSKLSNQQAKPKLDPYLPLDLSNLTRYRMSYAQFFVLNAFLREDFIKLTGQVLPNGGVLICEPEMLGGKLTIYKYEEVMRQGFIERLDSFVQNYPRDKDLERVFKRCVFIPDAKDLEKKNLLKTLKTKEEIANYYSKEQEATAEKHRLELNKASSAASKIIENTQKEKDDLENKLRKLNEDLISMKTENKNLSMRLNDEIQRRHILRDRPRLPGDVCQWVKQWFDGKLEFHEKAEKIMYKLQPEQVDLNLLCDALEYLATEYWNAHNGLINETVRDTLCGLKYGRPFDVCPTGASIEVFPTEYKIKYNKGYKGKPVETPLDLHLKVGVDSENLLRIYFLYDKEKRLIIVGSLPNHLPTPNYS